MTHRRLTNVTSRTVCSPLMACGCSRQVIRHDIPWNGRYHQYWNPDCRRCYGTTIEAIPIEDIEPLVVGRLWNMNK